MYVNLGLGLGLGKQQGGGGGNPPDPSPYLDSVIDSVVFEVDATVSGSYSGLGSTWANLTPIPADGEDRSAYDFSFYGTPNFVGTAGTTGAHFTLDNGADAFQIAANTGFIKKLHKTTGGTAWWFLFAGESLDSTWPFSTLFATGTSNGSGVRVLGINTEGISVFHYGEGTFQSSNGSTVPSPTGDVLVLASYDNGEITIWAQSTTKEEISLTPTPTTTDPDSLLSLGAAANGTGDPEISTARSAQWKLRTFAMGNEAITSDAVAADIISHIETRHGIDYTP